MNVQGLHHFAHRCRDAEETRHFYEDILGLPLVHIIREDHVPSTGEYCPYVHVFFQMQDGSCVAFFDLGDDRPSDPSPNTPAWVNHLALRMGSVAEIEDAKRRLEGHGIQVLGITDHKFIQSIYFFDPNGVRVELTCEQWSAAEKSRARAEVHARLAQWTAEKEKLRASGEIARRRVSR